jgi:hypothetical protein
MLLRGQEGLIRSGGIVGDDPPESREMIDRNMVDELCIECGRPLDGDDDDDLCVDCLREQDDAIRQRLRPHEIDHRDGKRLAKSKRPKHKPTSERDKPLPTPTERPIRPTNPPSGGRPNNRPGQRSPERGNRRSERR